MPDQKLLTLTTTLAPTIKFLVDGEEYEILGLDHLSKEDEADVMARFSRYSQTAQSLQMEPNQTKGTALALALREQRTKLLTKLTTLPAGIADKLPIMPAVKLITAVQNELQGALPNDDPDKDLVEDGVEDGTGDTP